MTSLALAFGLSLVSAVLAYGGSAMQALEARRMPDELSLHPALLGRLLRRPWWLLGTVMNIVAFGVQLVALGLASLAIVQPTFALGLIVLVIAAAWKLDERVGRRELAGIAAIIAGLAGLAAVAPRHDRLPLDRTSAIVLGGTLALVAAVLVALRLREAAGGLAASIAAGLAYAWISFGGTILGEAFTHARWASVAGWGVGVVFAAILALLAEMTALQRWPVTRSKPVVFVLQTILPAVVAPFFAAAGFGPWYGAPFAVSLLVVGAGTLAVGASGAIAKVSG